jgi:hypothetical protein
VSMPPCLALCYTNFIPFFIVVYLHDSYIILILLSMSFSFLAAILDYCTKIALTIILLVVVYANELKLN